MNIGVYQVKMPEIYKKDTREVREMPGYIYGPYLDYLKKEKVKLCRNRRSNRTGFCIQSQL